jgi:hypothetical protein
MAARLFAEDVETHWQRFLDYQTPELLGDEWRESPLPNAQPAAEKVRA